MYLHAAGTPKSPFQNANRQNYNAGRWIKHLFYKQNRRCYYCGVKTYLPPLGNDFTGKKIPMNLATIEHLYHKWDIRRPLSNFREHTVMCCYKCNQETNEKAQKELKCFDLYCWRPVTVLMERIKPNSEPSEAQRQRSVATGDESSTTAD